MEVRERAQHVRDFLRPSWEGYHRHNNLRSEAARYPAYSSDGFLELASAMLLKRVLIQTTGNQTWQVIGGAPTMLDYTGDGPAAQGRRGPDGRWHRCIGVTNYSGELIDLANGYDYMPWDKVRLMRYTERLGYRLPLGEYDMIRQMRGLQSWVDYWMHDYHAQSCPLKLPGRHYQCKFG